MTEITLEITQFCENDCPYCSSNATPEGKHLSFESIKDFLKKHSINTSRINISGGEPLAHPEFYKIYKLCEQYSKDIRVYTNLLKNIMFNGNILKEIKVEANVILLPGSMIPRADKVHFLKPIKSGRLKDKKFYDVEFSVSGTDCSNCDHLLLQADGEIVRAPCKKDYK